MYKLVFIKLCFLSMLFSHKAFGQNEFITEWVTTDGNIFIPTSAPITMDGEIAPYTYNYNIEWYNKSTGTQLGAANNITGDYTISSLPTDTIEVRITGTFPHFYSSMNPGAIELIHIKQWGNIQWKSFQSAFSNCINLQTVPAQHPDLTQVTNMSMMFAYAQIFNQDLSTWDVSNVTDMSYMFAGTHAFNSDLSTWNVSNVTNMSYMFAGTHAFNSDLSTWNVSNVTNMSGMFYATQAFNQNIAAWDVSNVTDMSAMFSTTQAFNQDIGSWNVSNVTHMSGMFSASQAFNQNIGAWNVSNVIHMSGMFSSAIAFNQNIAAWNVSNVTDMSLMFVSAQVFNQNIAAWDVSNVLIWRECFLLILYSIKIFLLGI